MFKRLRQFALEHDQITAVASLIMGGVIGLGLFILMVLVFYS